VVGSGSGVIFRTVPLHDSRPPFFNGPPERGNDHDLLARAPASWRGGAQPVGPCVNRQGVRKVHYSDR
jgi:hypothetical protein